MRLNLSTNGGALADPEYVRMVAPQFEPRKKVANFCVRLRASRSQLMRCYVILLEYPFAAREAKFFYVKGSHRPRPLTRFECFEYAKRRGHGRRGHAPDD